MATVQLQLPTPFDFKQPEEWPRRKRWFEKFRVVSGLAEDDGTHQVSTLLYCLGEKAGDVLSTTNITNDDCKKYDAVIQKYFFEKSLYLQFFRWSLIPCGLMLSFSFVEMAVVLVATPTCTLIGTAVLRNLRTTSWGRFLEGLHSTCYLFDLFLKSHPKEVWCSLYIIFILHQKFQVWI